MHKNKYIIAVYGIQDINNLMVPTLAHDHSIAIIKNNQVLHYLQLERLSRKKHSADMPQMLYDLLQAKKLLAEDLTFIFVDNVSGRSFINQAGNIRFEAPLVHDLAVSVEVGQLWWLNQMKKAYVVNHELAHLGSCLPFFGPFKNDSLLVHFDGGASQSNFSAWYYSHGKLKKLAAHWRLKKLSALFNANALTFGIVSAKLMDLNAVPGKFMGFASLGKYSARIQKFLEKYDYFADIWKSKKPFFDAVKIEFGLDIKHLDQRDAFVQDVAATIHQVFVTETYDEIKRLQQETKAQYFYYSGGSALNIVLNTKIINSGLFQDVFIPPCCNDSGLALGAAAFFQWEKGYSLEVSSPYLNNWNIEKYQTNYAAGDIRKVAEILMQNKIIGICNGTAEIGPRALGNRSLLCLANSKSLAKKISMEVKGREWYRPVAPIMLERNTKYFTGLAKVHALSKYMLVDFKILEDKIVEMQGAVHANQTARIQTVFCRSENPFIYDLLEYMDQHFGVKALINTSFNKRGEPIVHTVEDAKKSAQNMHLDALVIHGKLSDISV